MRYRLRTLLILLALMPPLLGGGYVLRASYIARQQQLLNQAKQSIRIVPMPKARTRFPPEMDYQAPPDSHREMPARINPRR